jgi:hypothetical protein
MVNPAPTRRGGPLDSKRDSPTCLASGS